MMNFDTIMEDAAQEVANFAEKVKRDTIPGDGMMICSLSYAALMACALRIISENDYFLFVDLMSKTNTLEEAYADAKLRKLIQKVPSVFQIRHEGCKGIVVKYPLEFIPELKDKDLVITEGARKFAAVNWSEAPLEVCNYLKRKSDWVALNPQFIQALDWENPNALRPVVDFWFDKLEASINDIAKAQEFHGIISSVDGNGDVNSNLVVALRNSADLVNDFQVINWRRAQYSKFVTDMKVGRLLVPGQYTYMVCDPAYMLNSIYGLKLDALKSGEYWFNNHQCEAGLFRSPLIAPFEAQKVNLIQRDDYWFFKDIVVFNGYDGAWEAMGGGDFDGDTCAVIPDDTTLGKIIVDGIRSMDYVVWEPAQNATKEEFSWENLARFNARVAKVDRTGVITNYASRALDISNHLKSVVYFAKLLNCTQIDMRHPSMMDNGGSEIQPHVEIINGIRTFVIRGFVHATQNNEGVVSYDAGGVYGIKTFDEILSVSKEYLAKVEYLRLMQGREIDSAKTGVAAEGLSGLDFVDSVKVEFTPQEMITRVEVLGRPVAKFAQVNKYQSLSPLARVHDYVCKREKEFNEMLTMSGSDKVTLLTKLLSDKERNMLNFKGQRLTLIDHLKERKSTYYKALMTINSSSELNEEEKKTAISGLKTAEVEALEALSSKIDVSIEVMAVACYIAAYDKNDNVGSGLTYGWLLFNELLSVFTRNNKKFELYRLPANATGNVSVKSGNLYINDKKFGVIADAEDAEFVPVQVINGKNYALIHKSASVVVDSSKVAENVGKTYTIGMVYGFKYNDSHSKDGWKNIIKNNGMNFSVDFDDSSRLVCKVGDSCIAAIKATDLKLGLHELVGHTVHVTTSPDYKETDNAIQNLVVCVIG